MSQKRFPAATYRSTVRRIQFYLISGNQAVTVAYERVTMVQFLYCSKINSDAITNSKQSLPCKDIQDIDALVIRSLPLVLIISADS